MRCNLLHAQRAEGAFDKAYGGNLIPHSSNKIGKGLLSRGRPTTHKPKPPKARAQSKILRQRRGGRSMQKQMRVRKIERETSEPSERRENE